MSLDEQADSVDFMCTQPREATRVGWFSLRFGHDPVLMEEMPASWE
jgi:hypothetical protein